ncbi:MAG: replication-associated recombination protein A [Deltaproteobacteria bacterium]|nr:replication-associated recombination protein A [Deltaproteobacteria bacterium]
MALFRRAAEADPELQPLAARMRPRSLEEIEGQDEILGSGKALREAIAGDRVPSMVLWGPPGSGKTTIARIVAEATRAFFAPLSAVLAGVAELREVVAGAEERRALERRRTIVFIDEIHRFNRAQQDALLPHVEAGTIVLIGATTENPSFAVNAALLSRLHVFRLEPLARDAVLRLLRRARDDERRGLRGAGIDAADELLETIADRAYGDARRALNTLEVVAAYARAHGSARAGLDDLRAAEEAPTYRHDKSQDAHYDLSSAFIKSLRGSDPDAAVYYLVRMVEAGDDPLFLLRRMLIFASEDVGLADPGAVQRVVALDQSFQRVGMPEGILPLSQAALYLALAPKSNSVLTAASAAREEVRRTGPLEIPLRIRNAPTGLMKELGYGERYRYPHDEPGHVAKGERYLPDGVGSVAFYEPGDNGFEQRAVERLRQLGVWPPTSRRG